MIKNISTAAACAACFAALTATAGAATNNPIGRAADGALNAGEDLINGVANAGEDIVNGITGGGSTNGTDNNTNGATNGTTKKELNTEKERPASSEAAIKSESTTKKPPVLTTKPAETEAVKINLKTEHGGFSNGKTLTRAQQQAIIDYENAYFSSLSNLKTAIPNGLFANKSVKNLEKAIWDSTVAIRKSALEDLSLTGYTFSLRVKKITAESKGVRVTLIEQNTQQFKSLSVLSEQFDVEHIFLLTKSENGSWLISEHECDAGAFYNFSYDSSLGKDAQLDSLLSKAKARQKQQTTEQIFRR